MGDVREVFISKRRNRNSRKYGFVRFKSVEDVYELERKLDNIVLGGLRMYVNIPKYGAWGSGLGFGVWELGFGVWVEGLGFRVWGLGFRV